MRHRKDGRKLGRTASHRKAMLANMAANLFLHKQIRTTHPKALEARRLAESLITKAKKGDLHSRRIVLKVIPHKDIVKILFDEIAPQYADRNGGYTRIIKLGQRKNDAAHVSLLSLVDFDPSGGVSKTTAKGTAKKAPKKEVVEETPEELVEEAVFEETEASTAEVEVAETPAEETEESETSSDKT
jgi:large subunit ribosomal protein L17